MKAKNIALVLLCVAAVAALLVAVFDFSGLNIQLNMKKYHTCEAGGREFAFYGGSGKVRRVKIRENGSKICTLSIDADAEAFSLDTVSAVELCDVNDDGMEDILVLTAADEDGDIHRALYLAADDGYISAEIDAVNFKFTDGTLLCEERIVTYLAETVVEYEVPSRSETVRHEYRYVGEGMIEARRISVAYFTETDIYCVGVYEYDEDHGEPVPVSEDWMSPKEYASERESISENFSLELP